MQIERSDRCEFFSVKLFLIATELVNSGGKPRRLRLFEYGFINEAAVGSNLKACKLMVGKGRVCVYETVFDCDGVGK